MMIYKEKFFYGISYNGITYHDDVYRFDSSTFKYYQKKLLKKMAEKFNLNEPILNKIKKM